MAKRKANQLPISALLNPFKRPIKKETSEAWAKMFEDGTKVSLFAIPVVLYNEADLMVKLTAMFGLVLTLYFSVICSRMLREYIEVLSTERKK